MDTEPSMVALDSDNMKDSFINGQAFSMVGRQAPSTAPYRRTNVVYNLTGLINECARQDFNLLNDSAQMDTD